MEKSYFGCECKFASVVKNHRGEVVGWLRGRYKNLPLEDGEDLVQESSFILWQKFSEMVSLTESELVKLWKTISRNKYTHWVSKMRFSEEWDDHKLQYGWEERDYDWHIGNEASVIKREMLYNYLESMKANDRKLIDMVLQDKRMSEISSVLGYKSEQIARNKKCRLLAKMKKDLLARMEAEGLSFAA